MKLKESAAGLLSRHDSNVAIGRIGGKKFRPEIQSKKFEDSVYLNIAHEDAEYGGGPSWEGNRLTTKVGKRKHKMYELGNGDLEYEIEYQEKPDSMIETLYLDFTHGLDFFLQPELTPEEAIRITRPEDVIGSYAVYWKESGRYLTPAGNESINYETGKFAHLYRPKVIAADGQEQWCEQIIDPVAKTLTIIMPEEFMLNAAYPVILDPTFGFSSIGASSTTSGPNWVDGGGTHSPASSGTIDSMSIYIKGTTSGKNITMGIYEDSAGSWGSRLCKSAQVTTTSSAEWLTGAVSGSPSITSGSNYWLQFNCDSTITVAVDTVSNKVEAYNLSTTYATDPIPSPAPAMSTGVYPAFSVYVTYTASSSRKNNLALLGVG